MSHYLLVDPYYRRIDVGTRSHSAWHWVTFGPGSVVITPSGDIELDSLDDELDAVSSIP